MEYEQWMNNGKTSSFFAGIDVQGLTQMACDARMMDSDARAATIQTIAGHMEDALEIQREVTDKEACTSCLGRRLGGYVTCLYIFIKFLYVANVVGQIFLLNTFLGANNLFYGFHILVDLMNGREWEESGNFPRVTMCDFEVRVLGNVHHHTVQCVLMINMFNEKIFLFLWFWFFLVSVITACSSLHWLIICIFPGQRIKFIKRYLRATDLITDRQSVKKFVHKFLGFDGIFCMRMISAHAGDITATELVAALWHNFNDRSRKSPIEMFEGPSMSGAMQSPTKMSDANFKSWLLGQHKKPQFDTTNPTRGAKGKRREYRHHP
uniref:Innexin n=1 Tax=Romanomermis culicivorax TaxID=13658 RepID=A0A915KD62_ROMCU